MKERKFSGSLVRGSWKLDKLEIRRELEISWKGEELELEAEAA